MVARARTAGIDCDPEHPFEPVGRDDELALEGFVPFRNRTGAGQPRIEVRQRAGEVVLSCVGATAS